MKKVEAVFRSDRLDDVSARLEEARFAGFTVTDVRGHGQSPERVGEWRGQAYEIHVTHKLMVEVIVEDGEVDAAVKAIIAGAHTGAVGDGLVTVSELDAVYSIRAGMAGAPAPAPAAAPDGDAADAPGDEGVTPGPPA